LWNDIPAQASYDVASGNWLKWDQYNNVYVWTNRGRYEPIYSVTGGPQLLFQLYGGNISIQGSRY
jgi:hypothetical protein